MRLLGCYGDLAARRKILKGIQIRPPNTKGRKAAACVVNEQIYMTLVVRSLLMSRIPLLQSALFWVEAAELLE